MLSRRWQGATRKAGKRPNSHHQANREQVGSTDRRYTARIPAGAPISPKPSEAPAHRRASHHQTSIHLEVGVDPRASEQYKREGDDKDQGAPDQRARPEIAVGKRVRDTLLEPWHEVMKAQATTHRAGGPEHSCAGAPLRSSSAGPILKPRPGQTASLNAVRPHPRPGRSPGLGRRRSQRPACAPRADRAARTQRPG